MIDAQAYVLRETGVIPELEDIQVDDQLESGQVRLKVLYSGLCATQMEEIFVSSRNAKYMPHLFGHEGVGVVEAVGPGVITKQVGDTCVIHWRQSSIGLDANPGSYFVGGQEINSGKVVTFSTQVVVPENRLTDLPKHISPHAASVLGCSLPTGWGSVVRVGALGRGDTVVITGLGAVGTSVAQVSLAGGAARVIAVEPKGRIGLLYDNPLVTHCDSVADVYPLLATDSITPSQILAIDTSGSQKVIESLVEHLPPRSRLVLVGMPRDGKMVRLDIQKLLDGLSIRGSNGGDVDPGKDLCDIVGLSSSAELSDLTQGTNLINFTDMRAAIENQRSSALKQILVFSENEAVQGVNPC